MVSSQNCRFWAEENPNWVINCRSQYSQKINVWCGILNERLIGPYFFYENLNSLNFLEFLRNQFWNEIQNLQGRQQLYFQLDGCTPHHAVIVRTWLNQNFPGRWIGRSSPLIAWPPRSPDLTPLDFYLWGTLKSKVYKSRPQNRQELCDRITLACQEISREELRNVVRNNRERIDKCIEVEGGLVERTYI